VITPERERKFDVMSPPQPTSTPTTSGGKIERAHSKFKHGPFGLMRIYIKVFVSARTGFISFNYNPDSDKRYNLVDLNIQLMTKLWFKPVSLKFKCLIHPNTKYKLLSIYDSSRQRK
jgi:hypothetical protein